MGVKDRNIKTRESAQEKAAKYLCDQTPYVWGECVAVDAIPNIEQFLNVSINILDLDNLPLLNTTGYIHESMVYKAAYDKGKLTCWLLFGSDRYDPITNIKAFLADRYFCEKKADLAVIKRRH